MTLTSSGDRVEANKATVTRMLASLSAGNVAGFTEALAPNYVRHSQAMPPELQGIRGRDAMHAWLLSNFEPFPDYREELEWLVGEGDFVAWRSRGTGTQVGALGPFPATRKRMDLVIYRVRSSWYGRLCTLCAVFGVLAVVDAVSTSTGGIFANPAFLVGVIVWIAMSSVLMLRDNH